MQISDTADALRKAEEDVPHITADLEHSLAADRAGRRAGSTPIADAKRAHQAVTTEADAARDELQTAKTAATTRQRELRREDHCRGQGTPRPGADHRQRPSRCRTCAVDHRTGDRGARPPRDHRVACRVLGPRQSRTHRDRARSRPAGGHRRRHSSAPATHASNSPAPSSASSPQSW